MKVSDIANRRDSRFCSVDRMIDREKMCGGKLADPVDVDGAATLRLDGGAGPRTVVAPYRGGGEISMYLLLELEHFDFDDLTWRASWADYRWDVERIDVAGQFDVAAYGSW